MHVRRIGWAIAATGFLTWMGCSDDPIISTPPPNGSSSGSPPSEICVDKQAVSALPGLWTELHPATSPPARQFHGAGYDEANDRLIVFGGVRDNANVLADVWVLARATDTSGAANWTELKPTGTPPSARQAHVVAYDATSNRLIVFGGQGDTNLVRDTFILTNANGLGGEPVWSTNTNTTGGAPFRSFGGGVYDPKSNTLTIIGGYGGTQYGIVNDPWILSNANGVDAAEPSWRKIALPTNPSLRVSSAPTLDARGDRLLAFGGATEIPFDVSTKYLNDTWAFGPLSSPTPTWTPFAVASPPLGRAAASLTFDPTTGRGMLFGGVLEGSKLTSATFLMATTGTPEWAYYDTGNSPEERYFQVAAYSSKSNRMVIFGGESYGDDLLSDAWVLDHANGNGAAPATKIEVRSDGNRICTTKQLPLTAVPTDAGGNVVQCPIVWSCSDPSVLASPSGLVVGKTAAQVTCKACCFPEKTVCGEITIDIVEPPPPSGGTSSSGGSSGSSSSGGATCSNGFFPGSQRSCTPLQGATCTCNDFPCSACISSADFPLANGRALDKGETGCIDTDGTNGPVGAVLRPCAPGLCCLVGGQCGGAGSVCGECLNVCE